MNNSSSKSAFLLLFVFISLSFSLKSQDKLAGGIDQLKGSIKSVISEKTTFNQEFTSSGSPVYIVSLKQEEVSDKGKSTVTIFDFNLADIDENLISRLVSGKTMFVNLKTRNQQKLIKTTVNGVGQGYTNEMKIYVNNVDEAREIMSGLKEIISPAAEMMKKRLSLSKYDDMLQWLQKNVGSVNRGTSAVEQKFEALTATPGKVMLQLTETDGGKMKSTAYHFNLSDISSNLVFFDIKGKDVVINLPTVRGSKLIKVSENGQPGTYDKDLQFYAASIDQARDIVVVMKLAVEKAVEVVAAAMPKVGSSPAAVIADINSTVTSVDYGGSQLSQTFSQNCVTELAIITSTPKGSKEEKYSFSFRDLNPTVIDFKVNKNVMEITLQTLTGQKLIKYSKDGQPQGYTDGFGIMVNDPEDARSTVFRLKKLIQLCIDQNKSVVPDGTMKVKLDWLTGAIGDVSVGDVTYNQSFTNPDGDDIRFEVTSAGAKSSEQEVFEFNLCDIDPNLVNFSVTGKNLFVKLETKYKQKIIKSYKNGKTQNFTNELLIRTNDIESARNLIDAIKGAAGKCK